MAGNLAAMQGGKLAFMPIPALLDVLSPGLGRSASCIDRLPFHAHPIGNRLRLPGSFSGRAGTKVACRAGQW